MLVAGLLIGVATFVAAVFGLALAKAAGRQTASPLAVEEKSRHAA
jgi:hypothetical protein